MKTPFKLQRTAPSTISTLDRTVTRTLPLYSAPSRPPLEHPQLPIRSVSPLLCPPADTSDLQKRISKLIIEDSQLSERSWITIKGGHSYTMRALQSRVALASPWSMPERVRIAYEAAISQEGHCEFQQGSLPASCLYYFAIGRQVFFYDVGRAIQTGCRLEDCFMHECPFENTVIQVKEVSWRHPILGEFRNKNILLIVLRYKLQFAAVELQGARLESGPRWMRITHLSLSLPVSSHTASHIVEDDERLYLLDGEGGVNYVSIQRTDWMQKLMGNRNRHVLLQATQPSVISNKAFFVSRKASILQKLQHYSKVVLAKATSFYGKKVKSLDLVCDRRQKMLFSLVDTNFSFQDTGPTVYRLLTAWDISKGKPVQKAQISEAQLYQKDISAFANFGITSNYRIVRLGTVGLSQQGQVQLMAMLECGVRLYLRVDQTIRVVHSHLPPPIERTLQLNCDPRQHHRPVELTHAYFQGNTSIFNLKQEGDNHTFITWKQNQRFEQEECVAITWGSLMGSPCGNPPVENYLSRLRLALESSRKEQMLNSLASSGRNPFAPDSGLSHLHELARDLFLPPTPFLHSTDSDIEYFCLIRPVDRIFSAVAAGIRDEGVLKRIFEGLPSEQVQFLLLQLFCDPDGIYLKDLELIDCMAYYQKRVLQQGMQNFEKYQKEFSERGGHVLAGKRQRLQPTYVGRDALTAEMKDTIFEVLVRIASRPDTVSERLRDDQQTHQSVCSSILLYLARALRFLWKKKLSDLKPKADILVFMIQPLHQILNYIGSPTSKTKTRPQKAVKLEPLPFKHRVTDADAETVVNRAGDPLQVMGRLISKITQLIQMCSKIDLRIKETFETALGMGSERFEAPLFRFLIEKYQHPTVALEVYQKAFPCFVGQGLEKSLRIEEECRSKQEAEIVAILKFHKKISNYLLKHLEETGKVHADEVRAFKTASSLAPQKSLISANVKEGVLELLDQLKKPQAALTERNSIILRLNSLLAEHLRRHEEREDRFYREAKLQMKEVSRRLTLQQLIIEYYEAQQQTITQVINQLKTSLFEVDVLKELVEALKVPKINIVFCLLFQPTEQNTRERLQQGFKAILQRDLDRHQIQRNQSFLAKAQKILRGCQEEEKDKWLNLQKDLKSIVSSVRSSIPLSSLIPLICDSLLNENSTSPVISISQIMAALPQIEQLFSCRHKPTLRQKVDKLPFPIISIVLWRVGSEEAELQAYFEGWLRNKSQEEIERTPITHMKEVLYQWLNVLCLSLEVELRAEFILQNSYKFIQIFLRRNPDEAGLKRQLWGICLGFSIANGLEEMYKDIFK